jgi:hypothetical protein
MNTTINAVFDAYLTRRYNNFKFSSLKRRVERIQKRPIPTETVKRALRQLRSDGFVDYTFDTKTSTYVTNY